jgi:hypothetical protein
MLKQSLKKIGSVVLATTMIISSPVFAAWNQFQGNGATDGEISTATPISENPSSTSVSLPNNNGKWTGIDAEPLMVGNDAYVLYNGGTPDGATGGVRFAKVTISDSGNLSTTVNDIQLDRLTDDVSQLSTPFKLGNTIYAATTYMKNELSGTHLDNWLDASGNSISTGAHITNGQTVTYHYNDVVLDKQFQQPQLATDIHFTLADEDETFSATMKFVKSDGTVYDLGNNLYRYDDESVDVTDFTVYNYSEPVVDVPAGTYTLELTIENNSGSTVDLYSLQLLTSRWNLYGITENDNGTFEKQSLGSGYGQATTPIKSNSDNTYIYFGIFEGDRCYYQLKVEDKTLQSYTPSGGDDFYWSGATDVDVRGSHYMVFGSDSGKLYVRPVGTNFSTGGGNIIQVEDKNGSLGTAGKIRSSIVRSGNRIYFTSRTTSSDNTKGAIWMVENYQYLLQNQGSFKVIQLDGTSVSTPAVGRRCAYVGYAGTDYDTGGVDAVDVNFTTKDIIATSGRVDASPIIYNSGDYDYIYFTTNTSNGAGYCYRYNNTSSGTGSSSQIWKVDSGICLQGMASDSGYLVFGNDLNQLWIVK